MKVVLGLLCVVLFNYAASETKTYPRGCIYAIGKCIKECEVGTHAYTTGCGTLTPEPSCDNPTPKPDGRGIICDFSACYCDPPTVRDITQKKCVKLEECPMKDDKKDKNDGKKDKNDDKKDKNDDKKDDKKDKNNDKKDDKKDKKDDKKD